MNRTRIKVCGITRVHDAVTVRESGCDAVGLVFWPGSPRYVTMPQAAELVAAVAPTLETVGIFVDADADEVAAVACVTHISAAQLHGALRPGPWSKLGQTMRLIRAVPVDSHAVHPSQQIAGIGDYLFDRAAPGLHGGTGLTFDWGLIEAARPWGRIWLAGGINAGNVGDAIARVRPYAVDVSSGVEIVPGVKSPELIAAFVRAVHRADALRAAELT